VQNIIWFVFSLGDTESEDGQRTNNQNDSSNTQRQTIWDMISAGPASDLNEVRMFSLLIWLIQEK
jgi:hypothetical protein